MNIHTGVVTLQLDDYQPSPLVHREEVQSLFRPVEITELNIVSSLIPDFSMQEVLHFVGKLAQALVFV